MIADLIYQYIDSHDIKYSAVAKKLGMSRQTLCNKLKGRSEITAEEYVGLCHVLGVGLDEFVDESADERKTVGA